MSLHTAWYFDTAIPWFFLLWLGTYITALGLVSKLIPKIGLPAGLLLAYVVCRCIFWIENFGASPPQLFHYTYATYAAKTLVECLAIVLGVLFFEKQILKLIPWASLVTSICVWCGFNGAFGAPSLGTAFIALSGPLAGPWIALVGLSAIATHHGSTALLILATQVFVQIGRTRKKAYGPWIAFALVALGGLAYFHSHGPLLDGDERIRAWMRYLTFWKDQGWEAWVFGMGPGSFMWHSLTIDEFKAPMFLCMHSDWLQMLFEYGGVGLFLACLVVGHAIKKAWGDIPLLASILGAVAFAVTYHPLRFFPSAIVVAFIFKRALVQDEIDFGAADGTR